MAQSLRREEEYLLDTVADFLAQMTELERLREAVRSAEAAVNGAPSSGPVDPKVIDLFAGPQLRF